MVPVNHGCLFSNPYIFPPIILILVERQSFFCTLVVHSCCYQLIACLAFFPEKILKKTLLNNSCGFDFFFLSLYFKAVFSSFVAQ